MTQRTLKYINRTIVELVEIYNADKEEDYASVVIQPLEVATVIDIAWESEIGQMITDLQSLAYDEVDFETAKDECDRILSEAMQGGKIC